MIQTIDTIYLIISFTVELTIHVSRGIISRDLFENTQQVDPIQCITAGQCSGIILDSIFFSRILSITILNTSRSCSMYQVQSDIASYHFCKGIGSIK